MKLFPKSAGQNTRNDAIHASGNHTRLVLAGAVIFAGMGTLLVKAAENPDMINVMREFNRPIRRVVEPYLPRPAAPLPQIFQARTPQPVRALSYAPRTESLQPLPRLYPETIQRRAEPAALLPPDAARTQPPIRNARQKLQASAAGRGAPTATNYCVRLCDGFAFPVGDSGTGAWNVQEAACRSACPGAQTALYTAPAGAKDFDSLARGGQSYSALPAAFRYREKISNTCSCRAIGATQSAAALMTDPTLRRGDITITRAGARHFDGAARLPYRPTNFSDALTKLKNPQEVAIVRAMEVAFIRGSGVNGESVATTAQVRNRVVIEVRQAEKAAARTNTTPSPRGLARGFVEVQAREKIGPVAMPSVKRAPGLVALN